MQSFETKVSNVNRLVSCFGNSMNIFRYIGAHSLIYEKRHAADAWCVHFKLHAHFWYWIEFMRMGSVRLIKMSQKSMPPNGSCGPFLQRIFIVSVGKTVKKNTTFHKLRIRLRWINNNIDQIMLHWNSMKFRTNFLNDLVSSTILIVLIINVSI